ncbi:TldD protein, part of proposed TldE/TldD proteolytic complex (PMID 12029038) [Thermococcus nautili]|uniref:TldD/PmbA family protein n=1 Tax=Thermococcus nautili TaxID=195522 RepID=UPI002555FD6A|nr:TldD/PmbA family protein [Thermococcus nautili]CAI1493227.1 TldD protein, part of proposed TldE/TldD proteolytic complex (PMID 12029038) [Thermococcus nautili]
MDVERAVELALSLGAEYAEVRVERLLRTGVMGSEEVTVSTRSTGGFGIRVLANGSWGFVSVNSREDLEWAVKRAIKLARVGKSSVRLAEIKPIRDRVKSRMKVKPAEVPLEEKVEVVRGLLNELPEASRKVVKYSDFSGVKRLITSEGTEIEWELAGISFITYLTASSNGRSAELFSLTGSIERGFEAVEGMTEKILGELRGQMNCFLHGKRPELRDVPVLLSPRFAGMIAHEALGHLAEADELPNTPLADKLGERIAPEFVGLSDGNVPDGHGNDFYDDEGVPVRKVEILKDGIFNEPLVDRERAFQLGIEPNGHARAESYAFEPMVRMRNTYFEPGDWTFEELLEEIKLGYYLVSAGPGQTGLDSSFTVGILEGYVIRNGEITEPIFGATASGKALDALPGIGGLGKELDFENCYCGKGQVVRVSMGGPHVLFKKGIRVV